MRKESLRGGLTLVELIIVLAVLVIIGAMLVPSFLSTTDKARLKSDIQSAQVIQNALELYRSENGSNIIGTPSNGGEITETFLQSLATQGYLKQGELKIQTAGAKWKKDAAKGVVVDILNCEDKPAINKVYGQLAEAEKSFVTGNT